MHKVACEQAKDASRRLEIKYLLTADDTRLIAEKIIIPLPAFLDLYM
jgi:hypothetical protein